MSTIKLYQQDVYLKECEAVILELQEDRVVLDRTIFFPTGGGQSCDLGFLGGQEVLDVSEKDGLIYHQVRSAASLKEGVKSPFHRLKSIPMSYLIAFSQVRRLAPNTEMP